MNSDNLENVILPQNVVLSPPSSNSLTDESAEPQLPRRKNGFFSFILEPAVFLSFFAWSLSSAVFQNQVLYQSCTNVFGFNKSDCSILGMSIGNEETEEINIIVQPYAAKIFMARSLLESIIPAICSFFIGSWSDKFGRKPVLFAAFLGYFFGYLILSVIAYLSSMYKINPWYYILSSIPSSLLGGSCGLLSGIFCYISDISRPNRRAFKMVVIEAVIYISLMFGSLLSSHLLKATNVVLVFSTSGIATLGAVLYVSIFLDESVPDDQLDSGSKFKGLFKWSLVKDMFRTCFEQRPNYDRMIIWLTMGVLTLHILAIEGTETVFYLFVMEKFHWTLEQYTTYNAVSILIQVVGNIIGLYILLRIFKFSISSLTLIAMGSQVLDSVVKATAKYSYHLYMSIGIGFFKGVAGPLCRTVLAQVTPTADIGKIMSFTSSLVTLAPLGTPIYTIVYSMTLSYYPGFFNIISYILCMICYIFLAIIYGIQKSYSNTAVYQAIGD